MSRRRQKTADYIIDPFTECWEWIKAKNNYGYGRCNRDGQMWGAHRWYYLETYGELPRDMCVLHTCDNPGCVNPEHLYLGTHSDNMLDMYMKDRHPCTGNPKRGV